MTIGVPAKTSFFALVKICVNNITEGFDNYNNLDVAAISNNIFPAFFTAQGDYNTKGPYFGTDIKNLKKDVKLPDNNTIDNAIVSEESDVSFIDRLSDETMLPIPKTSKKVNHMYCINKMFKNLIEDSDTYSMVSSDNGSVYNHVKKCKYCKSKINEKIKNYHTKNICDTSSLNKKYDDDNILECFDIQHIGYNLKEILIIILAGIVLVFILDMLVKIGKFSAK